MLHSRSLCLFVFTDPATPDIYTLSLHDALPISPWKSTCGAVTTRCQPGSTESTSADRGLLSTTPWAPPSSWWSMRMTDRKSTRLNSSHVEISYAVFCLKKKTQDTHRTYTRTYTV